MGKETKISWCDHTFNPWRGCTKVSPGCAHCYAEAMSNRFKGTLGVWGPHGSRVLASRAWKEPVKWNDEARAAGVRRRVFCASLADVFEQWPGRITDHHGNTLWHRRGRIVSAGATTPGLIDGERWATMDDARLALFRLIMATPHLDWLLLTKRPEEIHETLWRCYRLTEPGSPEALWILEWAEGHAPENVWLGATVEDRKHGLPRVDVLRGIPATRRFLSCEPLLEDLGDIDLAGIDWVICGGESGGIEKVRDFDAAWARKLRDQCEAAGACFFMKQFGVSVIDSGGGDGTFADLWPEGTSNTFFYADDAHKVWLKDRKHGADPSEWPADLRIQEWPGMLAAEGV